MPSPIQVNFTRGEITPLLHSRIDLDHYKAGVARALNWVPLRFGGLTRCPGSVYYGATRYGDRFSDFIPFEFRRDQTYAIEFGHLYFRFWNNLGQVESSPGVPYTVVHPYIEADLQYVQFRQSGDVIYLTCDGYEPRTLTRITETNWVLALHQTVDGPFLAQNATGITATPSAVGVVGGTIDFTFSNISAINGGTGFNAGDVGRPFRFFASDAVWRWYRITAIVSTVKVTALVVTSALPNTTANAIWRLGSWSGYTGYPVAVGIYEDRLGMGGTVLEPLSVWYSVSGNYTSHHVSSPLVDDDAISLRMTGGKLNGVQWLADGRDIVIGTEGTLRAVGRNDLTGAFSPSNVRQRTESAVACTFIPPILIENVILVLDLYRGKLFEAGFTQEVEGYLAKELTALNEHLINKGIRDYVYQAAPHKIIWMVTDEGTLLAGVYDRDQEVFGVTECNLGPNSYVESICVLPGLDKDGDKIWLTVRRTVNGATVRYVEVLSSFFRDGVSEQDYPVYAHAAGVYSGAVTNVISGLGHLEGKTVGVWAGGIDAGDHEVVGGEITFPEVLASDFVVFGIRYSSYCETLRIAQATQDGGNSMGKRVTVSGVIIDLFETYGIFAGSLEGVEQLRAEEEAEEDPYQVAVLRTGAYQINADDSSINGGVCVVETSSMHPATIRSITALAEMEP